MSSELKMIGGGSGGDGRQRAVRLLPAVAVILLLAFVFGSSYYTVDQGDRGVVLHYGAAEGESEPGLHFKWPFVTRIVELPIRQQNDAFEKQDNDHDYRMQVYTKDQQPVTVSIAILYHVTDVTAVYSQYGTIDNLQHNLINPKAQEQVKDIFGQFSAINAIQDRTALVQRVQSAVENVVRGPFVIDSVQVQDIAFSQSYENAVELRMQAIVAQQQAEAEKQKRITNADAAAYEVRVAADASAHQKEVEGQAEANAIRARGNALKENPEMPQLVAAEKWDGHLPQTMPPGGALPFLNIAK